MTLTLSVVLNLTGYLIPSQSGITITPWFVGHSVNGLDDVWSVNARIDTVLDLPVAITRVHTTLNQAVEIAPYPGLVVLQPRVVHIIGSHNPGSTWGRGQTHFTFGLRTIQVSGSRIWYNLSELEIENPVLPGDAITLAGVVQSALETHPIFGYTISSTLQIRSVEVVLSTDPVTLRILATRPGDPDCNLSLPRSLSDYDLTPTIKISAFRKETLVYHVSEKELTTYWIFEFRTYDFSR